MDETKLRFIKYGFIESVKNLPATSVGKWGKMNSQQMVEHVSVIFNFSSGKLHIPLVTAKENLPKYKEFLLSDKQFRENTKAPESVIGEKPLPLEYKNMDEAIDGLQKSIYAFLDYFKENENKTTLHPVFGELNFGEWILFHYKHVLHHAKQFGL